MSLTFAKLFLSKWRRVLSMISEQKKTAKLGEIDQCGVASAESDDGTPFHQENSSRPRRCTKSARRTTSTCRACSTKTRPPSRSTALPPTTRKSFCFACCCFLFYESLNDSCTGTGSWCGGGPSFWRAAANWTPLWRRTTKPATTCRWCASTATWVTRTPFPRFPFLLPSFSRHVFQLSFIVAHPQQIPGLIDVSMPRQLIVYWFFFDYFLCVPGNMARAKELAEQSHNPAACFHVARQLESDDQVAEALQFFAQAGAYGNAVRLCKVSRPAEKKNPRKTAPGPVQETSPRTQSMHS